MMRRSMKTFLLSLALGAGALLGEPAGVAPSEAWSRLEEGNRRFVQDGARQQRIGKDRREETAKGQKPFVAVLTCSDSRTSPEIIFDQGIGEIFVIRIAGNVDSDEAVASIEYAVEHLGVRLVLVMGHSKCGAVTAAAAGGHLPGKLPVLIQQIQPAVAKASSGDAKVPEAIDWNARMAAARIAARSPVVKELVEKGLVSVESARYDIATGTVTKLGSLRDEGEGAVSGSNEHGSGHGASASPDAKDSGWGLWIGLGVLLVVVLVVLVIFRGFLARRIGAKLIFGFVGVALIAGVVGVVGIVNIRTIDAADTLLYERMTVPLGQLLDAGMGAMRIRINVRDAMEQTDPKRREQAWKTVFELETMVKGRLELYRTTLIKESMKKTTDETIEALDHYMGHVRSMKSLQAEGRIAEMEIILRGDAYEAAKELRAKIDVLKEGKMQLAKETSEGNTATSKAAITTMVIIALFGVLLAVAIGVFLTLAITRPLGKGVVFARHIADGDLSARVDLKSEDELGVLAGALNEASGKLSDTMRGVMEAATQVKSASEQIAKGNQDLSSRTEAQASSVEETSASMEEMATSVKSNAESAQAVRRLSEAASQKAEQGVVVVGEVTGAMEAINESSQKIASIVAVMNNIAFQTNLLALNASIEAARAGEQGRGFAVVAVEVRKLAQRSDEASKEIATLISESSTKVEVGHDLVRKAGAALNDINTSIVDVRNLIAEISSSTQEQLTGIEEINKTVVVLDQNTQQNASLVEEQASMAEELSGQAQELHAMVSTFKVSETGAEEPKRLGHS